MGNLPIGLRQQLAEFFSFGALRLAQEQVSKDGTLKRAYALHDDQLIESVLMPYALSLLLRFPRNLLIH